MTKKLRKEIMNRSKLNNLIKIQITKIDVK